VAPSCKLSVEAGPHSRSNCPVTVELPWSYADSPHVALRDAKAKKDIPCQVTPSKGGILVSWLVNGLKAGETQKLTARPRRNPAASPKVVVAPGDGDTLDITIGGKLFTSYHYGTEWVRPFLHPVIGPKDAQVTRGWPVIKAIKGEKQDHPHHKSIWVAHGECDKVDNWSEEEGHGYQRHRAFLKKASGPVFGQIVAKNDWCNNKGRKQFEEIRDMRFYALPGGIRLFDVAVTFRMTERPVTFRDTKEGGLISVRVASSMDVPVGGQIENGYGGLNESETWGKSAPWCDYSGKVDGEHVGVAIMDHETNPRYPTGWHVRNYGLMTANCFAWSHYRPEAKLKGDMAFKKGSRTTWRYRLCVHRGNARTGKVADKFMDFIAPPKVTAE
jgi:Family of unknown function (DUF6807)